MQPEQVLGSFNRDIEFLAGKGLIEEIRYDQVDIAEELGQNPDAQNALQKAEDELLRGLETMRRRQGIRPASPAESDTFGIKTFVDMTFYTGMTKSHLLRARLASLGLTTTQCQYVPFFSGEFQPKLLRFGRPETILRLVLDNLAIPQSTVEWSQVLEFRADPESRRRLAQLRSWVADMATGSLTAAQVQDKLESALVEYQQHMEHHKMKYERGLLEIIVVTTAEVLEDLMRLKFSKVAAKLFQVFREETSLLEAERSAPGKAVAYIETVHSRFSI